MKQHIGLLSAAALAGCLLIGGLVGWLIWTVPLYVEVFIGLAAFAGIARLYVWVLQAWRTAHPARLDKRQEIDMEHARRELPAGVQTVSWHDSSRQLPAPPSIIDVEPVRAPAIPTFGQLLDQGQIGSGRQLILGYAGGQPITGDWNTLYSCGVGGMTGSGKSWAIAFLAGQSAAAGARIILIDPHAGDGESLANRLAGLSPSYMCDVASTPSSIESALKLAASKLDNRRAGRGGNWPILLIADEWTSMLRGKLGELLTATALDYAEQGRKFGCYAMLGAQAWQVDAAGAVRDRLASHYILRTRGDQFRYQTGLRGGAPEDTLTLPPGQAYMLTTRGELQRVTIPQMTQADILRLGALVDQPGRSPAKFGFTPSSQALTPLVAKCMPDGSQMVAKANQATTASQSARTVSPEAARVVGLFLGGKEPAQIVEELRGVKSSQGRTYQTALAEITALLREGMQS